MGETIALPPAEKTLRTVLHSLGRRHQRKRKSCRGFFWGEVMDLTLHGSTYSIAICRANGLDPDTGAPLAPAPAGEEKSRG